MRPRDDWQGTEAVRLLDERRTDLDALEDAGSAVPAPRSTRATRPGRCWASRPTAPPGRTGSPGAEVSRLQPRPVPPERGRCPAGRLTYGIATAFREAADEHEAWDAVRRGLEAVRDVLAALGMAGAAAGNSPTSSAVPDDVTLEDARNAPPSCANATRTWPPTTRRRTCRARCATSFPTRRTAATRRLRPARASSPASAATIGTHCGPGRTTTPS